MNYRETKFGNVFATDDALLALDAALRECKGRGAVVFFLVDEHTHELCLPRLLPELPSLGTYEILEVPAGEESKSAEMALQLWAAMAELGADRRSVLISLGGGMISDLGGFLAATYMRGLSSILIPTSLLGMVDAAFGGKNAVDVGGIKNLAGTFSSSDGVYLIPDFLETLPEREIRAGMAEMVKHGLITDPGHFANLRAITPEELVTHPWLIRDSLNIKISVVEQDPLESGLRKTLNFGHTFGHAIESHFLTQGEKALLHGEAVAAGMWLETELSVLKGLLDRSVADDIQSVLESLFGRLVLDEEDYPNILRWIRFDKKNRNSVVKFVLLKSIGQTEIDVEADDVQLMEVLHTLRGR